MRLEQGCIQKCFDIRGIAVETASSAQENPEMSLIGLHEPREVRSMILRVRDNHGLSGSNRTGGNASKDQGGNPLLPQPVLNTKELEQLVVRQNETMIEIKDVLQDMKSALFSMNEKMSQRENDSNTQ